MIEGQHDRFKDAAWYKKATQGNVIIGGAGGIGSWLGLFLARAGVGTIIAYDHDLYELHNMGGQFVDHAHVGSSKVDTLTDLVNEFSDETITGMEEMFTKDSGYATAMFSAFDNMDARKVMFERWKQGAANPTNYRYSRINPIFIDGRLLMEQMQVFCVRWSDQDKVKEYEEKHLFDDSEAEDELCTAKQTSHSAAMIAGFMTGFYTNHLTNLALDNTARDVPFAMEYFIPLNLMT